MKAGTSSLYMLLAQHPSLAVCRVKEPRYFSRESHPKASDYYRFWNFDPAQHHYALEASTEYTKYPRFQHVPERMAAFPAEFRLIYILRDPVARAESQLAHNVAVGRDPDVWGSRMEGLVAISSYAMQLDRYTEVWPDVPFLLLDLAELGSPEGMVQTGARCADFLGLDGDFQFHPVPRHNSRDQRHPRGRGIRLTNNQRQQLREQLIPDTARLRTRYGFEPANWSTL